MINTLIGLLLVTATCGYSQQSFQAQLFKDFNESSSVANRLVAESDVVIYRFFYLPKENHERSFMLELKIGTFVGPLLARESNYRLKIIEDGKIKAESTGKLSSTETENVLLAIVRSEIFSLPQGEQPLEADDGGAYMISTKSFSATVVFERTTKKETKMVIRMENYSAPAIEAATVFKRIAEDCFSKIQDSKK